MKTMVKSIALSTALATAFLAFNGISTKAYQKENALYKLKSNILNFDVYSYDYDYNNDGTINMLISL